MMSSKNNIVICPSVKHCGHNFMMEQIFRPHYKPTPPDYPDVGPTVFTGHFEETRNFNHIWATFGGVYPIFIPLRHPARVLESFRRRGLKQVKFQPGFYFQWYTMMTLVDYWEGLGSEIHYLHLDDNDLRYKQAFNILSVLGIEDKFHEIDWGINARNGCKSKTHNLEITDELTHEIPDQMIDFYYETKEPYLTMTELDQI